MEKSGPARFAQSHSQCAQLDDWASPNDKRYVRGGVKGRDEKRKHRKNMKRVFHWYLRENGLSLAKAGEGYRTNVVECGVGGALTSGTSADNASKQMSFAHQDSTSLQFALYRSRNLVIGENRIDVIETALEKLGASMKGSLHLVETAEITQHSRTAPVS